MIAYTNTNDTGDTPHNHKNWEEEFDEKFTVYQWGGYEPSFKDHNGSVGSVKSFIRSLLLSERRRIAEGVERMSKIKKDKTGGDWFYGYAQGYEQAFSEVLSLINQQE